MCRLRKTPSEGRSGDVRHVVRFNAVFIRAPAIVKAEEGVEILATFEDYVVAARQDNVLWPSIQSLLMIQDSMNTSLQKCR